MSFSRYAEYRDSGVEWLGVVPAHWTVEPCRAVFTERSERNDPLVNEDYLSLMANVGVIPYAEKGDVGNKKPEDLTKCKLVFAGDLVINSMNYGIGSYGLSSYTGVCSPVYIVLKPRLERIEERFAFRILENKAFQGFAQSHGNGILEHRAAINWDILKGIGVPLPPVLEQKAILQFLDHETAKIDALVAEQEKLITLLQEKRQAVISHAVTKGLNPNVPMKDSGVEWLGKVPEHWEVMPLKRDIEFVTSGARGWAENYADDGDLFLRIGNLTRDGIRLDLSDSQRVVVPESAEVARTQVKAGDILFSITAYLGSVAVIPQGLGRAFVSQHVALVRPSKKRCLSEWLAYLAISYVGKTHLETTGYGGTKVQLSLADVTSLPILIPSIDEQAGLIEFLNGETAKLDTLMAEARTAITLLQERRTALISSSVTGQIDVRNWSVQEGV